MWGRARSRPGTAAAPAPASGGARSGGEGRKALSGAEVLQEIRVQWAQALSDGASAPSTRYGYVRRERPTELATPSPLVHASAKPSCEKG